MKLLFLYGPPASGKYTIGKKLAEKTGFKLFHNHLTRDAVTAVFGDESKVSGKLIQELRCRILAEATKSGEVEGLIFTFVYAYPEDTKPVMELANSVRDNGGEVIFVQICAEEADLLSRVTDEHRQKMEKISNPDTLKWLMGKWDLMTAIPDVDSTKINTSQLTAVEASHLIAALVN